MELPKQYDASVQFGAVSNTGDPTGVIVPTGARLKSGQAEEALDRFRGLIKQRVPLTSAVKVDGEPLYRRAHRGESADRPQREVMVYDLSLQDFDEESQTARLLVVVGKGTYVRTLVEDLGSAIGVGAYTATLRRTRVGAFEVDQALQPQELGPQRYASGGRGVFKLDEALDFLPRHEVGGREARLAANGNKLCDAPIGRFRVYGPAGLIGIYEGRAGGARPLVIFSRPV
jgi:tRNA pseudouridine55 synthase